MKLPNCVLAKLVGKFHTSEVIKTIPNHMMRYIIPGTWRSRVVALKKCP